MVSGQNVRVQRSPMMRKRCPRHSTVTSAPFDTGLRDTRCTHAGSARGVLSAHQWCRALTAGQAEKAALPSSCGLLA